MYDAVLQAAARARNSVVGPLLTRLGVAPGGYLLATIHRAANTDDPARLGAIVTALNALAEPVLIPCPPAHPEGARCSRYRCRRDDILAIERYRLHQARLPGARVDRKPAVRRMR